MPRLQLLDSKEQVEDLGQTGLRPARLSDYIGQPGVKKRLGIALKAAQKRGEPLEHLLLFGPPGLGKTTLAHIISREMGSNLVTSSGPAIERSGDLMGILTNLQEGDIMFIDEIHRLPRPVEEFLYSAMEDFQLDFVVDKGAFAKTIKVTLKPFTLVGATTRAGLVSAPMRERFGLVYHLDFYPPEDLTVIIQRSSRILGIEIDAASAREIAERARGTPRIANRLLKRVRDYAEVLGNGYIDQEITQKSLHLEGIDPAGLDAIDLALLRTMVQIYKGGPVGIDSLAATLNEEVDTLQEVVEPYLLKRGFIIRTPSGRRITELGLAHLGLL
ncbi:MAG: Holliday junction branch migration DNA helicase RuvB [Syntrophomonadaceae bacterium]|nr:Holliday junction branch migration DNA helicase RuvB [Syntrophomonadaceae bacterium]